MTSDRLPLVGIPVATAQEPEQAASPNYRFNRSYPAALAGAGAAPIAIPLHLPESALGSIMDALEHPDRRYVIGVQWHPDEMCGSQDHARRLVETFVEALRGKATLTRATLDHQTRRVK